MAPPTEGAYVYYDAQATLGTLAASAAEHLELAAELGHALPHSDQPVVVAALGRSLRRVKAAAGTNSKTATQNPSRRTIASALFGRLNRTFVKFTGKIPRPQTPVTHRAFQDSRLKSIPAGK